MMFSSSCYIRSNIISLQHSSFTGAEIYSLLCFKVGSYSRLLLIPIYESGLLSGIQLHKLFPAPYLPLAYHHTLQLSSNLGEKEPFIVSSLLYFGSSFFSLFQNGFSLFFSTMKIYLTTDSLSWESINIFLLSSVAHSIISIVSDISSSGFYGITFLGFPIINNTFLFSSFFCSLLISFMVHSFSPSYLMLQFLKIQRLVFLWQSSGLPSMQKARSQSGAKIYMPLG